VAGGWRRLLDEELHNLYASPNIVRAMKSRSMRWAGHVVHTEMRNAYKILVPKPEEKIPLGISRSRWEDNVRIGLRDVVWGGVDWIHLAQDMDQLRDLVNTVIKLRVP
jgi:hypothetical protein